MDYGKIKDGVLELAPKGIEDEDGTWHIPPTEKMLKDSGYKPIEETPMPEPKENYVYSFEWKEQKSKIVRVWHEEYIEPEYSLEERLKIQEDATTEIAELLAELLEKEEG